jgi:hypothetical protein
MECVKYIEIKLSQKVTNCHNRRYVNEHTNTTLQQVQQLNTQTKT